MHCHLIETAIHENLCNGTERAAVMWKDDALLQTKMQHSELKTGVE